MSNKPNKDSQSTRVNTIRSAANIFYLFFVIQSIALPILLVLLYDKLAGGILNGFWGVYRQGIIDGNILLIGVNPIVMLLAYGLLILQLKKFVGINERSKAETYFVFFLTAVATVIAAFVIFWKALTT